MSYTRTMTEQYPRDYNVDTDKLVAVIEATYDCAQTCTACADACLSESDPGKLIKCIRLNADCADISATTGRVLSRQTEYDANVTRAMLQACIQACRSCAEECGRHAEMGMEHCRTCAEACRACETACEDFLATIG